MTAVRRRSGGEGAPHGGAGATRDAAGARRDAAGASQDTVEVNHGTAEAIRRLAEAFRERFGADPTHHSRAPGRVNLIGEHIDYNLLPVLPMALTRCVRIALRPRADCLVRVANLAPEFPPCEFEIAAGIPPGPSGSWENYVKAPAQALARRYGVSTGFDAVVASDLPVASGLSSSSALVNAVALALLGLEGRHVPPLELAEVTADAERYTGTRGGGMDQAISLGAVEGCAARIDFAPLRLTPVPVPGTWRFVVADSGVRAEKSGAAQEAYNLRADRCGEALRRVAEEAVRAGRIEPGSITYPHLLRTVGRESSLDLGRAVLDGALLRCFRHVVTEAGRVEAAVDALERGDLHGFGALMDGSHRSLRDDYEVSTPELDALVEAARHAGAAGARLTGAGFGGCVVALCARDGVDALVKRLSDACGGFGGARSRDPRASEGEADRGAGPVFIATPGPGAAFGAWPG